MTSAGHVAPCRTLRAERSKCSSSGQEVKKGIPRGVKDTHRPTERPLQGSTTAKTFEYGEGQPQPSESPSNSYYSSSGISLETPADTLRSGSLGHQDDREMETEDTRFTQASKECKVALPRGGPEENGRANDHSDSTSFAGERFAVDRQDIVETPAERLVDHHVLDISVSAAIISKSQTNSDDSSFDEYPIVSNMQAANTSIHVIQTDRGSNDVEILRQAQTKDLPGTWRGRAITIAPPTVTVLEIKLEFS